MKVAVFGGGSSYTPELVNGFLSRVDSFPMKELWLVDIDPDRLDLVGGFARRMVAADGTVLRSPCFGGWDFAIAEDSENRDAAWELMIWATSPEMERRLASAMPSSRISVLGDPEFQEQYIEYKPMLLSFAKSAEQALTDVNPLLNEILMAGGYQA